MPPSTWNDASDSADGGVLEASLETQVLKLSPELLDCVFNETMETMQKLGLELQPVAVSLAQNGTRELAVKMSVFGARCGSITMNLTQDLAVLFAERFLGTTTGEFDEDVCLGVCGLSEVIAKGIQERLVGSAFQVDEISAPALISGGDFNLIYARNHDTVCVEFAVAEMPATRIHDRFFSLTLMMVG